METKSEFIKEGSIDSREYQTSIVDNVLDRGNSLVVMPTGLGKTIIAVFLMAKILEKKKNAKILFLAPTKPLVLQHAKSLTNKMKDIKIEAVTGTLTDKKRIEAFENNQIICATPQTIENEIKKKTLLKERFDLIIFDEAHRAAGKYAYVEIANFYSKSLFVGLTASPGSTKAKIKDIMKNLNMDNIEIKTKEDIDVAPYTNPTKMYWVKVELPEEMLEVKKILDEFVDEKISELQRMGYKIRTQPRMQELLNVQRFQTEQINRKEGIAFRGIKLTSMILKIRHASTLLETQGIETIKEYFEKMGLKKSKSDIELSKDERIQRAKYIIEGLNLFDMEHPKIKKLKEIILDEFDKDPNQKIIVFNHYRDSVQNLENILNKNPLFRAKRFVGQASKKSDKGLNQKEQQEIIEDFREGKYNILLATSVAEEGLDIPNVDTIILYEPVPSDVRTIQRKGRTSRFTEGKVYVLITKGTRDETFYWSSLKKEENMIKHINDLSNKNKNTRITKALRSSGEAKKEEPKEEVKVEKQTLLTDLFKEDSKKKAEISIFIDTRERRSKTFEYLQKKEANIIIKQMDIGDYQVGEETIIERKTANDFINSIINARLFSQAIKLSVFEKPVFLIEGDLELELENRGINKAVVYGTKFSLMFDYKIPILFAKDSFEASEIIYALAKREQLRKEKPISLRRLKKEENLNFMQQYIIEGLPYVGPKLATRMLEKFKTVKSIFNSELERFEKIEGIGKKKAEKIFKVLNEKYGEN
jgi:ERCC4-related helicase